VCRNEKDFERPLDLTHSYLRAMSPVHNKYLANMGVRSSMSISIVIDSELWGLVACHGYGDVGMRVSLPLREVCKSIVSSCFNVHFFKTKACDTQRKSVVSSFVIAYSCTNF